MNGIESLGISIGLFVFYILLSIMEAWTKMMGEIRKPEVIKI